MDFWWRLSVPVLLSMLVGVVLWGVFSAVTGLLFVQCMLLMLMFKNAKHLNKLNTWLKSPTLERIPVGSGNWEELFSQLYKMVKKHIQTEQDLADELQHIQQATSALPQGVAILNEANRIEWFNLQAEQHFNLNPEHDVMQDITYLVRQPEFIEYMQGMNFTEPLMMRPARHDETVLSIKLVPYGGNKRLLISSDITQLERIEAMRRDFVANVSHELRTPLTVVNGFVENLQDMPDLSSASAKRALELMAEQAQRMENLVADLLTLSRLENDQSAMNEDEVDITGLLNQVLHDGILLSAEKHILRLEVANSSQLLGNREDLYSAFANLVGNAIRYTPEDGVILLRWHERGGQMVFSVQDTGIGIASHHIPRLTERFYRVDRSRSRETGGTGLGLAIVKHVAMRHQAKLEVLSDEGKGSIFSLVFPRKRVK